MALVQTLGLPQGIMRSMSTISWNNDLKLILSDVDDTIAETYTPAEPAMIAQLEKLLTGGCVLFLVSGGSLRRMQKGITDFLQPTARARVLISHCSGAEVWGFAKDGALRPEPFYSLYDQTMTVVQQTAWRRVVAQLVEEFGLRTHPVRPKAIFWKDVGQDPHDVMFDDRGPQITLEVVNGTDLSDEQRATFNMNIPVTHGQCDLRIAMLERAQVLFTEAGLPVTPRLGGMFALDLALAGVSKTSSIQKALADQVVLESVGLTREDLQRPGCIEIWGDKFSAIRGGTDRHMSEAVDPEVRSIDFRDEDPSEFLAGYNTVLWQGKHRLHQGLLEYLHTRPE